MIKGGFRTSPARDGPTGQSFMHGKGPKIFSPLLRLTHSASQKQGNILPSVDFVAGNSFEFHGTLVIQADERCSRAEEGGRGPIYSEGERD